MTAHIQRFVNRLRAAEQRNSRDMTISLGEARDLHADITRLLAVVHEIREQTRANTPTSADSAEISGGSF